MYHCSSDQAKKGRTGRSQMTSPTAVHGDLGPSLDLLYFLMVGSAWQLQRMSRESVGSSHLSAGKLCRLDLFLTQG